jgi:hemoglobin-like flavoprotein
MTKEQIDLVKKSFEKIVPISEQAAALFYAQLFELNPRLRRLFKGDLKAQGRKLMQVIGYAVENLERLDEIIPQVRALGARHAEYGVEDRDYETVGAALLWTFEKALSREFTVPMKDAWSAVYNLLAQNMKDASHRSPENAAVV